MDFQSFNDASKLSVQGDAYALALCEIQGWGTPKNYTSAKFLLESVIYNQTASEEIKNKARQLRQLTL